LNTNFVIADAIEHATLAAVAPESVQAIAGWLLPFDSGTIGRAKSAVPLGNADTSDYALRRIADRYTARGMRTSFRVANHPEFADLRANLQAAGYRPSRPTWVQTAATATLAAYQPSVGAVHLHTTPDAAWAALFLGEGFDPIDGACRVNSLSRAQGSLYASARLDGQTVAAGAASFSNGWVSVHGMRTSAAHRQQGWAGRILSSVGAVASARGIEQCFLQVEGHNTAAQSLYRRAGFVTAWEYAYWAVPAA
jgi:ribosomal protein S18 acetylase RimI-like enzyme